MEHNYDNDRILQLLKKHTSQEPLNEHEMQILSQWLSQSTYNQQLWDMMQEPDWLARQLSLYGNYPSEAIWQKVLELNKTQPQTNDRQIHFLRSPRMKSWFKYAAIALLTLGLGAYLYFNTTTRKQSKAVANANITPGTNKAILILADGRKIILDSATNGLLALESGNKIVKRSSEIIYGEQEINDDSVAFNTMSTPRGGQYQLTLSDGTRVWLNAASSITYPSTFTGKKREISIDGEAYFEVTKNPRIPFIVKTGTTTVVVLGTSFNINHYFDEPENKITLVDGRVKVNEQILQPGQAFANGKIMLTDINQDLAWKNGYFNFQKTDIQAVMRAIARWYDVDVRYKTKISSVFFGKISRETPLSDVIKILEATGKVKIIISGRTLIVQ